MKMNFFILAYLVMIVLSNLLIESSAFCQCPNKISYQAVVRNSSGAIVSNNNVTMKISIVKDGPYEPAVYVETRWLTTNTNGLVNFEIGGSISSSGVYGDFSTIDWANGPTFIRVETDPNGGLNFLINSTSQLLSVPFALFAETSGNAIAGSIGPVGPEGFTHFIGEHYGGGIVFHLWKDTIGVEHGLILNLNDIGNSQWSNISAQIGTSAQSTWDGVSNSNSIVAQIGHTSSAAKLCLDLVSGGQNDWYLPSFDELNLLSQNFFNVNKSLSMINGATQLGASNTYWSSSETDGLKAIGLSILKISGNISKLNKNSTLLVRGIRSF